MSVKRIKLPPGALGEQVDRAVERFKGAQDERDRMRRLFNRLEAAISHHKNAAGDFTEDYDDALYAARDKILRDYAEGKG